MIGSKWSAATLLLWASTCVAAPPGKVIYRITGIAVNADDSAPIPYCRMQISESANQAPAQAGRNNGAARGQQPTEVDADVHGHFLFTLDHAGAYVVTGSAREFRRQNFDEHERFFSSIVLTTAVPAANITFRMERDAALTGLILDEAGEPVRNAQVAAEVPGLLEQRPGRVGRGGLGRQAGFAQTDDRGRYEISGLTPGSYRVRVTAQPWYAQSARFGRAPNSAPSPDLSLDVVYPTQWYPGVSDEAAADMLALAGGEERQVDFHMTPLPAVRLIVPRAEPEVAGDGQPRPQRSTYLIRISPAGGGFNQSTTNGTTVEFSGLAPGIYELRTNAPDGRPDPEARQFRVAAGSTGAIDLANAALLTKVTLHYQGGDPEGDNGVSFLDTVSGRSVYANSGQNFWRREPKPEVAPERAVYLTPGHWEVHIGSQTAYLSGLQATGAGVSGSTITVSDQPASLTLTIGLGRGSISGMAQAAGKGVEGAMVLLVPAGLGDPGNVIEVERDQTNSDGSFTLRAVVPGKYILLAIDHGWGVKWRDLPTLSGYLAKGVPLEIGENAKVQRNVEVVEP